MSEAIRVSVSKLIRQMELVNLSPEIDTDKIFITDPDINRPALQLTGFYEEFDNRRIQIIGNVETCYLYQQTKEVRRQKYEELISRKIPCLLFSRGFEPCEDVMELGAKYGVPILQSKKHTSSLLAEIIRWLNVELAPSITIHGVLVDVYGEGVLIMGESGIGKSEAALELIKRGHRLVSDDVVILKKVSDATIVGSAPAITRHFIELRGIGIINVKTLFGVESVKDTQAIDLVIKLEEWDKDKEYDRLGVEDRYIDFLGNRIVCHHIPIRPGRNLAIIVESAAVNNRQKQMGYNAAQEFTSRIQKNMAGQLYED